MLCLEYLFHRSLKVWFIDPLCDRGRIKRIVWNVWSLHERNVCYFVMVFLFSGCLKQKGWLVTEQASHWYMQYLNCSNKFILLQYRWYHHLSASSLTATVAKKHCTSAVFYIWFTWGKYIRTCVMKQLKQELYNILLCSTCTFYLSTILRFTFTYLLYKTIL